MVFWGRRCDEAKASTDLARVAEVRGPSYDFDFIFQPPVQSSRFFLTPPDLVGVGTTRFHGKSRRLIESIWHCVHLIRGS